MQSWHCLPADDCPLHSCYDSLRYLHVSTGGPSTVWPIYHGLLVAVAEVDLVDHGFRIGIHGAGPKYWAEEDCDSLAWSQDTHAHGRLLVVEVDGCVSASNLLHSADMDRRGHVLN